MGGKHSSAEIHLDHRFLDGILSGTLFAGGFVMSYMQPFLTPQWQVGSSLVNAGDQTILSSVIRFDDEKKFAILNTQTRDVGPFSLEKNLTYQLSVGRRVTSNFTMAGVFMLNGVDNLQTMTSLGMQYSPSMFETAKASFSTDGRLSTMVETACRFTNLQFKLGLSGEFNLLDGKSRFGFGLSV